MSSTYASGNDGVTRIGVDVGGTFTDLILYDGRSGEVRVAKEPTTPGAPESGVASATRSGVPAEELGIADYFLHGTTVGLNALLERRGATVGLLATRGFRDTLELRRGDADEPYNLFWRQPVPLVPRSLRVPITERMRADGEVHVELDPEDVRDAARFFADEGVECVAVVYMNAYVNPAHELETERILREAGYTGPISLSHRVSGEFREYERTCTTVLDAYVRPRMSRYLQRLETDLRDAGFNGSLLVTRSGGGSMRFDEAEDRPFETILSGPVAGAEGAAELARDLGLDSVITADVGGTSFDTCLITDGRPQVMYQGKIIGLPVQSAWVDVRSIGAGGGSIAHVDVGGLLRVGPQSAGADPGPACYGKGGTKPTVTDAACVLGMLGEGRLASGITLDVDAARTALEPLAEELSMTIEELAKGIITIANAAMADAIRSITVEQGQDPRRAWVMAFGGAGPLFAGLLARELEVTGLVVPPYAGNFSAWGLLGADLTQTVAKTRIMRLDDDAVAVANELLAGLFAELADRTGRSAGEHVQEIGFDMRYAGQEHSLTVDIACDGGQIGWSTDEIAAAFTREYARTFAHEMDEDIQIVSVRASVRTPLPRLEQKVASGAAAADEPARTFEAYSFTRDEWLPFRLVDRASLDPGAEIAGPAIVLEATATTYLDAGFDGVVDPSGSLLVKERA
ncbi:MAG: hydantoinase/oxoprolinase family protein [Actinomycetota bacterium]